jgi:hypothetical protein
VIPNFQKKREVEVYSFFVFFSFGSCATGVWRFRGRTSVAVDFLFVLYAGVRSRHGIGFGSLISIRRWEAHFFPPPQNPSPPPSYSPCAAAHPPLVPVFAPPPFLPLLAAPPPIFIFLKFLQPTTTTLAAPTFPSPRCSPFPAWIFVALVQVSNWILVEGRRREKRGRIQGGGLPDRS